MRRWKLLNWGRRISSALRGSALLSAASAAMLGSVAQADSVTNTVMVPKTLTDWTNAMGGECGEAQNVAKKIRRIDTGVGGNTKGEARAVLLDELMFELADTVTYAFCVADFLKFSLEPYFVHKFNEASDKQGIEVKI